MHSVAKRKEAATPLVPMPPITAPSPLRSYVDAPMEIPDESFASEEELRAWSEFDQSRPTSPAPPSTGRAWRLPKQYRGVFQERYVLLMLLFMVVLFIAATCRMDTKAELEEIKRLYDVDESISPGVLKNLHYPKAMRL